METEAVKRTPVEGHGRCSLCEKPVDLRKDAILMVWVYRKSEYVHQHCAREIVEAFVQGLRAVQPDRANRRTGTRGTSGRLRR